MTTWREELVDADTAVSGELVSLARSLSLLLSPARSFWLARAPRALSLTRSFSLSIYLSLARALYLARSLSRLFLALCHLSLPPSLSLSLSRALSLSHSLSLDFLLSPSLLLPLSSENLVRAHRSAGLVMPPRVFLHEA
jgi:hypothetical protein